MWKDRVPLGLVHLLCLLSLVLGQSNKLGWKESTDYTFSYKSTTSIQGNGKEVKQSVTSAQIILKPYHVDENCTLLSLEVAEAEQNDGSRNKDQVYNLLKNEGFNEWFSFRQDANGQITEVFYIGKETRIVSLKKAIVGSFSANFLPKVESKKNLRKYSVQDRDHTGEHTSVYTVKREGKNLVYSKIKSNKEMESKQKKEIRVDVKRSIIQEIHVFEEFQVPKTNLNTKNLDKPTKFEGLPDMSGSGYTEVKLIRVEERNGMIQVPYELKNDTVEVRIGNSTSEVELADVIETIKEDVFCILNSEIQAQRIYSNCFKSLVDIFSKVNSDGLKELSVIFFGCNSTMPTKNVEKLVDVLAQTGQKSGLAQDLLAEYFLQLKPSIPKQLSLRALYHIFTYNHATQNLVSAVENLCFWKPTIRDSRLSHTACLALGAIARVLSETDAEEAERIVKKINSYVLPHHADVYKQQRRSKRSLEQHTTANFEQAVLVSALGNAGHPSSYHLISSLASNSIPSLPQRAAIHSLRHFHSDEAANTLLKTILSNSNSMVRSEAIREYMNHPAGLPIEELREELYNFTTQDTSSIDTPLSRGRRSVLFAEWQPRYADLDIRLHAPSVNWKRNVGSEDIGAEFGMEATHGMQLEIRKLEGTFKLELYEEVYAQLNLGFVGQNIEMFRTQLCHKGEASYDYNILQESSPLENRKKIIEFDRVAGFLQTQLSEVFKNISVFDTPMDPVLSLKEYAINLPFLVHQLFPKRTYDAIFYKYLHFLPIWKLLDLYEGFKASVSLLAFMIRDFNTALGNCLTIDIFVAATQINNSIATAQIRFENFTTHPLSVIEDLAQQVSRIGDGLCVLAKCLSSLYSKISTREGIPMGLYEISNKITLYQSRLEDAKPQIKDHFSWIESLSYTINNAAMDAESDLLGVFQDMIDTSKSVSKMIRGIIASSFALTDTQQPVDSLYESFSRRVELARGIINGIFGFKFHRFFPNQITSSNCESPQTCSTGIFPSTIPQVSVPGIKLKKLAGHGNMAVAPVTGYFSKGDLNSVKLQPISPLNTFTFYIYNIAPSQEIEHSTGIGYKVYAGDSIGLIMGDYIFLVKVNANNHSLALDPTKHLTRNTTKNPRYETECNDFRISMLGNTIQMELGNSPTESTQSTNLPSGDQKLDLKRKSIASLALEGIKLRQSSEPDNSIDYGSFVSIYSDGCSWCAKGYTDEKALFFTENDLLSYPQQSCLPENQDFMIQTFNYRFPQEYTASELITFLNETRGQNSAQVLVDIVTEAEREFLRINQDILHPRITSAEFLIWQLEKLRIESTHARAQLFTNYLSEANAGECPSVHSRLPKELFCRVSSNCLSISCAVDINTGLQTTSHTISILIDPCRNVTYEFDDWKRVVEFDNTTKSGFPSLSHIHVDGLPTTLLMRLTGGHIFASLEIFSSEPCHLFCGDIFYIFRGIFLNLSDSQLTCQPNISIKKPIIGIPIPNLMHIPIKDLMQYLERVSAPSLQLTTLLYDITNTYLAIAERNIETTLGALNTEFEEEQRFITSGSLSFPSSQMRFFSKTAYLMLGSVPVKFDFDVYGYIGSEIQFYMDLKNFIGDVSNTPNMGLSVSGDLAMQLGEYTVGVNLRGDLLNVELPITGSIQYQDVPLLISLTTDLILQPLQLNLTGYLEESLIPIKRRVWEGELWYFSELPENTRLFDLKQTHSDFTPPIYNPVEVDTENPENRMEGGCVVSQAKNRDYTNPAFLLQVDAIDDMSDVSVYYSIGSYKGGKDLVEREAMFSNVILIPLYVPKSTPLYFTVHAINSQGLDSISQCVIPSYDVTPPTGRVSVPNIYSSNPNYLEVDISILKRSPIISQYLSIGYGKWYSEQIVPFQPFNFTNEKTLYNDTLSRFAPQFQMKLIAVPFKSAFLASVENCATFCVENSICLSFNYNPMRTQCELLRQIVAEGVPFLKDREFDHYERLGESYTANIKFSSLNLTHNQLYFFNVQVENELGQKSILSSESVLTDFTPPEPGLIVGGSEETRFDGCYAAFNLIEENRCYQPYKNLQHRIIRDGIGSKTVFNGDLHGVDRSFFISGFSISANFDGFRDNESGIYGFRMFFGTAPCNISQDPINPHQQYQSVEDWTYLGTISHLSLAEGKYYISIAAINNVILGGPGVTTVCHTTAYVIDKTRPVVNSVSRSPLNETSGELNIYINASDSLSLVHKIEYSIGTTPRDTDVIPWTSLALGEDGDKENLARLFQVFHDFPDGIFFVRIRVENNVGLQTVYALVDDPIRIDRTEPLNGSVFDGATPGVELKFTSIHSRLCAHWEGFSDPDSGIKGYELSFRNSTNILGVKDVGKLQSSCFDDLDLKHNTRYYSIVNATNGAETPRSTIVTSNGVLVDLTAPQSGILHDGDSFTHDLHFTSDSSTISAVWSGYNDPESGITLYRVSVGKSNIASGYSNKTSAIHTNLTLPSPEQREIQTIIHSVGVGLGTSYTNHRFRFIQNDFLSVTIETINGALLSTKNTSTGLLIDLSPPELLFIKDGALNKLDTEYQTFTDNITVSFSMVDLESGIEKYEISLFRYSKGERLQVNTQQLFTTVPSHPGENGVSHQETINSLDLINGFRYHARVKVFNQAGLYSAYSTDGVTVDTTPPLVEYVRIGTPNQQEDIINGIVRTSDPNSLSVYWQATDLQSDILNYNLSLGTCSTCNDIQTQNFTLQYARLTGINLTISSEDANTVEYYVSIIAVNRAGQISNRTVSNPLIVLPSDIPGVVRIGHSGLENDAFQSDTDTLTIHFNGFKSEECGIRYYEWGVGTTPYLTDVMPFTTFGLVMRNDTHGQAQGFVPLRHGLTYYATVRATTGCLNRAAPSRVIEAASSVIRVDVTAPELSAEIVIDVTQESEQIYQTTTDNLQAAWYPYDEESEITSLDINIGSFPGGTNIFQMKDVTISYLPADLVQPWRNTSNFVTITAHNAVGLTSSFTTRGVSVDTTEPIIGTFTCPESIPAGSNSLHCEWSKFSDPQSAIAYFELSLGSEERDNSSFHSLLDGAISSYTMSHLNGSAGLTQGNVFVTLATVNVIGLKSYISRVVIVDGTPPEVSTINLVTTTSDTSIDPGCSPALTSIRLYWSPFIDEQSGIDRYLLGVGTSPGEFQIGPLHPILYTDDPYTIHGLSLVSFLRVYVTLRVYNKAGLYSTQVSASIQTTTLHAQQVESSFVFDGLLSVDSLFQDSLTTAAAQWHFSSLCPAVRYEWGIFLANGTVLQSFNSSSLPPEVTSGTNDGLTLARNQTYYVIVRKYNQAGYVETMRSNGVSIRIEPPRPGQVFDGLVPNHDFNYQISRSSISAIWTPFGLDDPDQLNQKVAHYEVAVGTGRGTEFVQSNVVSFTDVGLDLNITFTTPLLINTIYYTTIRAISVSGTQTEVTTNGISVLESTCNYTHGSIILPRFQSFNRSIAVSWSGFQSCVPWDSYQYAVSTSPPTHNPCNDIATDNSEFFDVLPFQEAGLDTSVTLLELSLQHNTSYYITLRAIDEAAECLNLTSAPLLVDSTPPIVDQGYFKVGFDQQPFITELEPKAYFITSTDRIYARWYDFFDPESGLEFYEISLYQGLPCPGLVTLSSSSLSHITSVKLGLETEYTFYELNLSPGYAYYLKLTLYNKAGASSEEWSNPILLDLEPTSSGDVRHGFDWYQPLTGYQSDAYTLQGSIAYLYTSLVDAFRAQDKDMLSESSWSTFIANRLDAFPSFLYNSSLTEQPYPSRRTVYQSSQVINFNDDEITVKTQPDTEYERMRTGAVFQSAGELFYTNSWTVDIRASDNKDIITSVQLFERVPRFIQEFEINFGGMFPGYKNTTVNSTQPMCIPQQGILAESHTPKCDTPSNQTDCTFASPYPPIAERTYPAIGFQLYKGDTEALGRILFWSRQSESRLASTWATLPFDPSSDYHTYQLQLDNTTDRIAITLIANGLEVAQLNQLPELTAEKAQFLLHAWNVNRRVLPFTNPLSPPIVYSYFRPRTPSSAELRSKMSIQSKGRPFIHINSPILEFEIGVGTTEGSTDVMNFTSNFQPCIPCNTPCSIHYCDSTCFNATNDITTSYSVYNFTLTNLNLTTGKVKLGNITESLYSNSPNLADSFITKYKFIPTVYYISVRGITASGTVLNGVSKGVQVDFTPPECTKIVHRDPASSLNTPVGTHQISTTSLAVFYTCEDIRSPIYQNWVAVGTDSSITNVRNFTLSPLSRTLVISSLTLVPNTTYYVKVRVINRAGLATTLTSTGVQVFDLAPNINSIRLEVVSLGAQPLSGLNDYLLLSRDMETIGMSWQGVNQTNLQQIFWSAGTSPFINDVIPRIEVGSRTDSFAILQGDKLLVGESGRNYSDLASLSNACLLRAAGLVLEPGRIIFQKVDLCTRDPLCTTQNLLPTLHIRQDDVLIPLKGMNDPIQFTLELNTAQVNASIFGLNSHEDSYLLVGAINRDQWSGIDYGTGFSSYLSYIVDPVTTILNTTRYLRNRIISFTDFAFFSSISNPRENISFGNILFKLSLNFTQFDLESSEISLIFWNRELSAWQDLRELCDDSIFQRNGEELITNYCYEYKNPSQNVNLMLALALLKQKVQSNPPMLLTSCFSVNEGSEQVMIQLEHCDNEFDQIEYSIASKTLSRKDTQLNKGNYSITPSGLLSYTPCSICSGDDVISVVLKETGEVANLGFALSPIVTLEVKIINQNDPPKLIARIDNTLNSDAIIIVDIEGRVLDPSRTVFYFQNTSYNLTYPQTSRDFQFQMIAYDYDINKKLTLNTTVPTDGKITNKSIPLSTFIERNIISYIDTLYTYSPNISGNQTFSAIVHDQDLKFSKQITLHIRVFNNPCYNNGTCESIGNYLCHDVIRIVNFSQFKCNCPVGYTGEYCETLTNLCLDTFNVSCGSNESCVPHFIGYSCYCGPDWPCQGQLALILGVSISISLLAIFITILVVAILVILAIKYFLRQNRPFPKSKGVIKLKESTEVEMHEMEQLASRTGQVHHEDESNKPYKLFVDDTTDFAESPFVASQSEEVFNV